MDYSKNDVRRAIEQFDEAVGNVQNADVAKAVFRMRQLFDLIETNHILKAVVGPYLRLEFDEKQYGVVGGSVRSTRFVIPEDEDLEISVVLKVLRANCTDDRKMINLVSSLYLKPKISDDMDSFYKDFIVPALQKLHRKMKYMIEDIGNKGETIPERSIQIINIERFTAHDSQIAVGTDIRQINFQSKTVFEQLERAIKKDIEDENIRSELLELVTSMNRTQNDKKSFRKEYDLFLTKIGTYMTILGPFLPLLSNYFK